MAVRPASFVKRLPYIKASDKKVVSAPAEKAWTTLHVMAGLCLSPVIRAAEINGN
jgi:hypothetical protein